MNFPPATQDAINLLAKEGFTIFPPHTCKQVHVEAVRSDEALAKSKSDLLHDLRISFSSQVAHFIFNELELTISQSRQPNSSFITFSSSLFVSPGPAL